MWKLASFIGLFDMVASLTLYLRVFYNKQIAIYGFIIFLQKNLLLN